MDLTPALLPELRRYCLPGLAPENDFVYPDYTGRSILNIPASVCQMLGAPAIAGQPLDPRILQPLGDGIRHVVLVLMDSLALHRLQRWMQAGSLPVWERLAGQGLLAPLTSITPSTTSAALTTLWTGRSAAEHGITGYEMWLKEYGMVANTILHAPMSFKGDVGSLERAGFKPEAFVPLQTLGPHLAAHGVKTYALQHSSLLGSGLSRIFLKDTETQAFYSAADLWINVRHLLESHARESFYAWVYWSEVDHFGHLYGPDDERTAAEFAIFSQAMQHLFIDQLNPALRQDTLLILTADHGQLTTRKDAHYELRSHPALLRRLHIYPTGENRLTYLHIRPGQFEAVREYLERTWPNQFKTFDPAFAVEAGLFGPGLAHDGLLDRLGDLVIAWQDDAYIWWAQKDNILIGRHGGLHPQEMLVPFLAARL